jgi:hypothetical protein
MSRQRKLPPYSADEIAADPELAAALVRDAEPLLAIEREMKALREQKADLFDDLRLARFKPEYAKAWVAAQMPDEEKDAARAEKAMELARVVAAMDVAQANKGRARAGVGARNAKPTPRQEAFDKDTGELLGDAQAPAGEIAGDDVGGSPDTSEDGPTREDGRASPASLTDGVAIVSVSLPEPEPADGLVEEAYPGFYEAAAQRIAERIQADPAELQHALIASAEARMEAAAKLLGQRSAAE